MLLVKKIVLYITFFVMAVMMLALGTVNYYRIVGTGAIENELVKYYTENLLYLSIVGVVILLVAFFVTLRGGVRVFKEIDKVTELSRYGRYYSGESLKKLGKLGDKINRLFGELNRLNEMKSLKVNSLSQLLEFFLEHANLHCFIADVQGSIGSASKRFIEKLKIDQHAMKGSTISDVLKDFDFKEVTAELTRSRIPVSKKGLILVIGDTRIQGQFTFYPIFNVKNELSNIVCVSEKETLLEGITKKADQIREAQKRITGIFKRRSGGTNSRNS